MKVYTLWRTSDHATISERIGRTQSHEVTWMLQDVAMQLLLEEIKKRKGKFQVIVAEGRLDSISRGLCIRPYGKGFCIRLLNKQRENFDSPQQLLIALENKLARYTVGDYKVFDI